MNRVIGKVTKTRDLSRLWPFPLTKRIPKLSSLSFKERASKTRKCDSKSLVAEENSITITARELSNGGMKSMHKYTSCNQRSGNRGGWHNPVPKGNLAVYVGSELKRYVIPTSYLGMPELRVVMDQMAEEYGHHQKEGGLRIPICEEQQFEEILASCKRRQQIMSKTKKGKLKKHYSFHL
ncbi:uncharacterized protein LOC112505924 [Cynara cardunculus var. scolymus]|uniref:Auxin responsive SAUR protein n=1 Tax=Cynara cardunculus var. scolymus TaxID=59895 RepID=A0A103YM05_CYNCS|nr:uncharacterized protein LOC112505924 [Cynara cardunculus var. scolymus]KVI11562.1 Auxin responsive SAUR protein [Cynara cardunculus var. scolymus]